MATKRLALELGLVQKRKIKSSVSAKVPKAKQEFDYIIVLDFESTCWENGPRLGGQEIIEFPAVLLDLKEGKIVSEFQQYVMPTEQPVLSAFCTNLTGITQEQVDAGVPLGACLYLFSKWINKLSEEYKMTFNTNVSGKQATFATWSDWDLGVCLLYECQRKNLRKPDFFNQWIDIRATYKNFYQRRPQGLAGALKDLGISFEGREHSGICDTRNTATLISRMVLDGCVLTITKSIASKSKGFSVKEAAQKMFNQVTSMGKRKSNETLDTNEIKRKQKTFLQTKSYDISSAHAQKNSENKREQQNIDAVSFDLGLQDFVCDIGFAPTRVKEREEKSSPKQNKTSLNESGQNPSTSCGTFKMPNLPLSKLKIIIPNKSKKALNTSCAPKTSSSTPKLLTYNNFKTPTGNSKLNNSSGSTSDFPNSKLRTPMFDTHSNIDGFKKTPPLCECGRRAKLLLTSKPGPNQGRHFFTCPNGKANLKRNCSFFKWEDEPFIKASPKTPTINLNSHLVSKSMPHNRGIQRQKTLGIRRALSDVTNRYYTHNNETTKPATSAAVRNSSESLLQITPYIVRSKQISHNMSNGKVIDD